MCLLYLDEVITLLAKTDELFGIIRADGCAAWLRCPGEMLFSMVKIWRYHDARLITCGSSEAYAEIGEFGRIRCC